VTFFEDPKNILLSIGVILGCSISYLLVKEFISILKKMIEHSIGKPSLVRETSKISSTSFYISRLVSFFSFSNNHLSSSKSEITRIFEDVILPSKTKERIINLATSTRNVKKNNALFRHVLLYGPPGTGKTMVAKKLATSSQMDYAIMSGGDVGPLGKDAVSSLHHLFNWAKTSKK